MCIALFTYSLCVMSYEALSLLMVHLLEPFLSGSEESQEWVNI